MIPATHLACCSLSNEWLLVYFILIVPLFVVSSRMDTIRSDPDTLNEEIARLDVEYARKDPEICTSSDDLQVSLEKRLDQSGEERNKVATEVEQESSGEGEDEGHDQEDSDEHFFKRNVHLSRPQSRLQ